jgi:hypothetical protein
MIAKVLFMKINSIRILICGVVLTSFVTGTTAMACHNSNDPLAQNHKKHHKKSASIIQNETAGNAPTSDTGFLAK